MPIKQNLITVVVRVKQGETEDETTADIIIQHGRKTGIQSLPAAQNSVAC
ncbi:hypothetical protein [Arsenophonus nasoniae]|uniref:Uncharacterized protein n=1 Tax=Arsenophonus nasoniae TaxID=638 RepID=A0AA95GQQ7_9GAMM|nr:hypothetical protein [Arsenophonus nasoniae]WGM01099.1 hypothetical protein QE210_14850 [Arsenophonus nasoniae]